MSSSGSGLVSSSDGSSQKDARFDSHCLRTFSRLPGILIFSVSEKRLLNGSAVLPMHAIPAQGTLISEIPKKQSVFVTFEFCKEQN